MLLRNPLALENMNEFRVAKSVPIADEPTASELRTNRARRDTAGIEIAEQRQLLCAELRVLNQRRRDRAKDFEREHYCALSRA